MIRIQTPPEEDLYTLGDTYECLTFDLINMWNPSDGSFGRLTIIPWHQKDEFTTYRSGCGSLLFAVVGFRQFHEHRFIIKIHFTDAQYSVDDILDLILGDDYTKMVGSRFNRKKGLVTPFSVSYMENIFKIKTLLEVM